MKKSNQMPRELTSKNDRCINIKQKTRWTLRRVTREISPFAWIVLIRDSYEILTISVWVTSERFARSRTYVRKMRLTAWITANVRAFPNNCRSRSYLFIVRHRRWMKLAGICEPPTIQSLATGSDEATGATARSMYRREILSWLSSGPRTSPDDVRGGSPISVDR